jgi:hypothetical protein
MWLRGVHVFASGRILSALLIVAMIYAAVTARTHAGKVAPGSIS